MIKKYSIKVIHVARRFISNDLNELNIGYDLVHFKSMSKMMQESSVIFESKDHKYHQIKQDELNVYLVPGLLKVFTQLIKLGKKNDLIVAQNPFIAGLIAVIVGFFIKKPVIISVHGYKFTVGRLQSMMKKFVCSRATKIRANSRIVKNTIIEWGITPDKIIIIEDRVDCEHFTPQKSGDKIKEKLGIKNKMIISVGSLIEIKGFDTLLKSIKIICEIRKDITFVIIGEGYLRRKLEKNVKEFGIEKNVIFIGNVNYEKLPYYYSASDLFVHPSYVESMGRVILEAQSSGTPVIATNIGGIPEALCKNGGILIPPKEPKSLAESIINLIDNQETLIKMAKYGREFVLDKFEFWKQEEKLIEFYNNTIQNS